MLFERFIKHQKKVLAFFAAFLMVSFLVGPALYNILGDQETDPLPKLYGKEIERKDWQGVYVRVQNLAHLASRAIPLGAEWDTREEKFYHRWLILDRIARENGLVVTDEEVAELKDSFAVAWYDAQRGSDGETAESRADKIRIGNKKLKEYVKELEWERSGWTWEQHDQAIAEWARIRKLLSFLLEHEVKISIDDVFREYQSKFTTRRLRYLEIDAAEALARLEAESTPEELRKKAIDDYVEKHSSDPALTTSTEADFVWLAPDVADARREVDGSKFTDADLQAHLAKNRDRFPTGTRFEEIRELVRSDLVDDRVYEALRGRVAAARKAWLDAKGKKSLAEIALEHDLAYRRELGVDSAGMTGPDGAMAFPDIDVQRLSRAVFQQLEPGDPTIVAGQVRPVLQRPVFLQLVDRRRTEAKPKVDWEASGGLATEPRKGLTPDRVLEAYFEANATKPVFARPASVTIEVIMARRETLARTVRVTTQDLERFHADNSKHLYRDGEKRDLAEDRVAIEPIVLARKIQERLTGGIDALRSELAQEDKKGRSFELVAGREGYESLKLGPIGKEGLAAHPILGKAEGFVDAAFALEKEAVSERVFEAGDARFFVRLVEKDVPEPPTWETVDRDRVARELVREYALAQAVSLLDRVKKDIEAKSPTAESLVTLFGQVARSHGYAIHETKSFREASELEDLKGATGLSTISQKEPGAIEGPVLESALSAAVLYQLVEKDEPEKSEMKPGEVAQIRQDLREKAIRRFQQEFTSPREVVAWAEALSADAEGKLKVYEDPEAKK